MDGLRLARKDDYMTRNTKSKQLAVPGNVHCGGKKEVGRYRQTAIDRKCPVCRRWMTIYGQTEGRIDYRCINCGHIEPGRL